MERLSRRRFLQISAATFGAATAHLPGGFPIALAADAAGKGEQTIPTYCEMCFWRCGGVGYVRDGKLWKFEGNPKDLVSRGRLCTRGTGAVGAVYDPDRLRKPLIRRGKRGAEQWTAVTWGEALDYAAERLKSVKAQHGAESIALFKHGIGVKFIEHVLKSYGVINVTAPSYAQCRGPRDAGYTLTYGAGLGSPEPLDIANSRCLVLIGSHLGENMHNTQVQEMADAIGAGASLIVVDPRQSVAASKAKFWLPIRPGTDIALLRAWMHVIVGEELYDKAFVAQHGEGFNRFAADLRDATPEWAAKETGLDARLIRDSAREMAKHRPATLVHPGRRSNWYGDDSQRSRAMALLNALMGNWGQKGGVYVNHSIKVPPYPLPPYPKATREKVDNPGGKYPFAEEELSQGVREATITGKPYPIKAWVVYSSNLLSALPNRKETLAAIDKLDLLVVLDTVPSEIAGYADVVLPECTFLERLDELNVVWGRQGSVQIRQPVVPPQHESQPGWWIAKQLANRLGIGASMPFKDMDEYLAHRVGKAGLSYAQLKKDGVIVGPTQPIYLSEGAEIGFDTPSGKVEFWSQQLADAKLDPVPKYVPPEETPKGTYRLITGRAPMHTFTRTQSNPLLRDLMGNNEVWVNAGEAKRLGLRNGQLVRLRNQDGVTSGVTRVKATERIRTDCLYMVHGFGVEAPMLRSAHRRGASAAQLNTRYRIDPVMGGTSIHTNFVAIVKEA
jgi:thiosulfate reductase/polysulfide reductase chain A